MYKSNQGCPLWVPASHNSLTLQLPRVWSQICFLLGRFSVTDPVPTGLSLGQKQAQRRFVFLLNRIQGDSPCFFACKFSKLFSVTGGSRMCLWSSHLPHYSESIGSKLLGTLIPLLKSSLQLLTGVLKEASFPLVILMWFIGVISW